MIVVFFSHECARSDVLMPATDGDRVRRPCAASPRSKLDERESEEDANGFDSRQSLVRALRLLVLGRG